MESVETNGKIDMGCVQVIRLVLKQLDQAFILADILSNNLEQIDKKKNWQISLLSSLNLNERIRGSLYFSIFSTVAKVYVK